MFGDIATNEDKFAAIKQFQTERCDRQFLQQYGAVGTAIGWQVRQRHPDSPGLREPTLCLRVLVPEKADAPPKALPKSFPFEMNGEAVDIPVDVCAVVLQETALHSSLIPSKAPTVSGYEAMVQMNGTLGGWAWHPPSDSLVLLSCCHVLGHEQAGATNQFWPNGIVARVRGGVRVVGGEETNRVDCAFADPVPQVVRRFRFLETVPPVLAASAPIGSSGRRTLVSRYRRPNVVRGRIVGAGGTITGVVDAVSVQMYVPFPTPEGNRNFWFTDLFLVQPHDGLWGSGSDSGSLIFESEPAGETRAALGIYMGQVVEGLGERKRTLGLACQMDHVVRDLGVEFVAGQPIFAFLGSLIEGKPPLDFLPERRGSTKAVVSPEARRRAEDLVEYMRKSGGRALVGPLKRQRRIVIGLLMESKTLRLAAARALRPLLTAGRTPEEIFAHVLTKAERRALQDLITLLRRDRRQLGMQRALKPYADALRDPKRKTVGDVLRRLDDLAPKDYSLMA